MRLHKKLVLGIATVAFAHSAAAFDFSELDVDLDGHLTQEELKDYSGVVSNWSEVDTDSDGYIGLEEFSALIDDPTLAEKTGWNRRNNAPTTLTADTAEETALIAEFVQLDTNQDGMLSRQEMGNHDGVIKSWTDLDANQDDYLDQDEFNGMVNDPSLTEQTGWDRRSTPPDGASS